MKTTVNGIQISYERRGRGTPLLLVHGFPLDHSIWEPVVPLLEADFDLILPDLRGFGASEVPSAEATMDDFAADLAGLLDHLGIEKAAVAGHSMGGYVTLALARAWPERVTGLGLVASQALADSPERKAGRLEEAERILAQGVGGVAEGMPGKLTASPVLQGALRELILRQQPAGLAAALRAMAGRPDSSSLLMGFDGPVVIVHGQADALIPVERAREARDLAKRGTLVEIEAAGHLPMMEMPGETAQTLKGLS